MILIDLQSVKILRLMASGDGVAILRLLDTRSNKYSHILVVDNIHKQIEVPNILPEPEMAARENLLFRNAAKRMPTVDLYFGENATIESTVSAIKKTGIIMGYSEDREQAIDSLKQELTLNAAKEILYGKSSSS